MKIDNTNIIGLCLIIELIIGFIAIVITFMKIMYS